MIEKKQDELVFCLLVPVLRFHSISTSLPHVCDSFTTYMHTLSFVCLCARKRRKRSWDERRRRRGEGERERERVRAVCSCLCLCRSVSGSVSSVLVCLCRNKIFDFSLLLISHSHIQYSRALFLCTRLFIQYPQCVCVCVCVCVCAGWRGGREGRETEGAMRKMEGGSEEGGREEGAETPGYRQKTRNRETVCQATKKCTRPSSLTSRFTYTESQRPVCLCNLFCFSASLLHTLSISLNRCMCVSLFPYLTYTPSHSFRACQSTLCVYVCVSRLWLAVCLYVWLGKCVCVSLCVCCVCVCGRRSRRSRRRR